MRPATQSYKPLRSMPALETAKRLALAGSDFWIPLAILVVSMVITGIGIGSQSWTSVSGTLIIGPNASQVSVPFTMTIGTRRVCVDGHGTSLCSNMIKCNVLYGPDEMLCEGRHGAYGGSILCAVFLGLAMPLLILRRYRRSSEDIYGLTCFCFFSSAVFSSIAVAFWATAYDELDGDNLADLIANITPSITPDIPVSVVDSSASIGAIFIMEAITAALLFLGMYLTAYYGFDESASGSRGLHDDEHALEFAPMLPGEMQGPGPRRLQLMDDD
eukprot:m.224842 g.224842  ORF g.224842 m.224842 type:complete len:273 (+) comp11160_c0_seq1:2193-3011(+)